MNSVRALPSSVADFATPYPAQPGAKLGNNLGELESIDRYYPLKKTYTWTYQVLITADTATKSVTDTTRIEAYAGSGNDKTADYTSKRYEGTTLLAMDTGTMTQNSAALTIEGNAGTDVIALPLVSGKTWTSGSLSARCYTVGNLTVLNKAYKDVLAIAYTKDGETKAVRWLAPGVGIIRQVSRAIIKGQNNTETLSETLSELVSAQVSSVTAVTLLPASLSIKVGDIASINAQVYYDDGSVGLEFEPSVQDSNCAVIEFGKLKGKTPGTTTLTAISTQDSSKFATISVTVLP